ncbi:hypothetical protein BKA56DRAFT_208791 [Ilyonectria sp. MPI-CAGE-AT-0026]|nr:hypothetical protein BKA56DRAFT_208791 [Ilyonectria sp. MPI-CAGE-AT-0026]
MPRFPSSSLGRYSISQHCRRTRWYPPSTLRSQHPTGFCGVGACLVSCSPTRPPQSPTLTSIRHKSCTLQSTAPCLPSHPISFVFSSLSSPWHHPASDVHHQPQSIPGAPLHPVHLANPRQSLRPLFPCRDGLGLVSASPQIQPTHLPPVMSLGSLPTLCDLLLWTLASNSRGWLTALVHDNPLLLLRLRQQRDPSPQELRIIGAHIHRLATAQYGFFDENTMFGETPSGRRGLVFRVFSTSLSAQRESQHPDVAIRYRTNSHLNPPVPPSLGANDPHPQLRDQTR